MYSHARHFFPLLLHLLLLLLFLLIDLPPRFLRLSNAIGTSSGRCWTLVFQSSSSLGIFPRPLHLQFPPEDSLASHNYDKHDSPTPPPPPLHHLSFIRPLWCGIDTLVNSTLVDLILPGNCGSRCYLWLLHGDERMDCWLVGCSKRATRMDRQWITSLWLGSIRRCKN